MKLIIVGNDKKVKALERELSLRLKRSGLKSELIPDSEDDTEKKPRKRRTKAEMQADK